jgi:hypothetical protein
VRGWGGGCCAVPRSQRREWSPIRVLQPVVGRPFHPGSGALNGVQLERVPRLSREVGEREMVKLARDCLAFVDVWRHRIQSPHRRPASRARAPRWYPHAQEALFSREHTTDGLARGAPRMHRSELTHEQVPSLALHGQKASLEQPRARRRPRTRRQLAI